MRTKGERSGASIGVMVVLCALPTVVSMARRGRPKRTRCRGPDAEDETPRTPSVGFGECTVEKD
ncbi:hypothetical protein BD311DRAFT_751961 [Dichomitus squalens]|uniref:Uncharacterized protein n=1 Tax=Dichomitus squalens TaxID=114155 RepID=A0A4V2K1A3_9APHY|nr:hypothetical protein BD311DRAFT_751961 [Dichomitus squalens]